MNCWYIEQNFTGCQLPDFEQLFFLFITPIILVCLCLFVFLCTRRSCVAVEFCWLAVTVACCSAECLDVSSILQSAAVTTLVRLLQSLPLYSKNSFPVRFSLEMWLWLKIPFFFCLWWPPLSFLSCTCGLGIQMKYIDEESKIYCKQWSFVFTWSSSCYINYISSAWIT